MKISVEQAQTALKAVEATKRRSANLHSYALAAPYLILWGTIWLLGFGLNQWSPHRSGLIWTVLDIIGVALGLAIVLRRYRHAQSNSAGLRYIAISVAFGLFFWAAFFILRPAHPEQIAAFIALTLAMIYVVGGLASGRWRIVMAGALLAAVMLVGYVIFKDYFFLWMSLAGGGLLIGTGLWLKRI